MKKEFNTPNTIYKIISKIDLEGTELSIPDNCTLDFQGGTITNGTIILNNTRVLPQGSIIQDYITAAIHGNYKEGQCLYDVNLKKFKFWNGTNWVEEDKVLAGTLRVGTFEQKPTEDVNFINVGFAYFCTDKQTSEGSNNGIMIYYKGDNTWVDALGRIVS